jgi:hypothetical protein
VYGVDPDGEVLQQPDDLHADDEDEPGSGQPQRDRRQVTGESRNVLGKKQPEDEHHRGRRVE